jgi:FkbM family methyltransferase
VEIAFSEHNLNDIGSIYFATDNSRNDSYIDDLKNNYNISQITRYILNCCKGSPGCLDNKFIDVGANLGTITIPAAKTGIKTLAIEALPRNFILLLESIKKNQLKNVTCVHAAATNFSGIVNIAGESAWASIGANSNGIEVPATTLDTLTQVYNFSDAKIIKIIVQGAELMVLKGMENLFDVNPNIEVIFEANAWTCGNSGYSIKTLKLFFEDMGYNLYCLRDNILSPSSSRHFQEAIHNNYLATKREIKQCNDFEVRALSNYEIIDAMLADMQHSNLHMAYFLSNLKNAPNEIKNDPRIQSKIKELERNIPLESHIFETLKIGM